MELNKKTEQYKLEDFFSEKGWTTTGTVYNNTNGTITINCNTINDDKSSIGNINYVRTEENIANISYDVSENIRMEYNVYINALIDNVLKQFV